MNKTDRIKNKLRQDDRKQRDKNIWSNFILFYFLTSAKLNKENTNKKLTRKQKFKVNKNQRAKKTMFRRIYEEWEQK